MSWNDIQNNEKSGLDYTKFDENKAIVIRIMDEEPITKWRHWLPASKRSITCLGKGCPVCEKINTAKDAGLEPPFSSTKRHTIHVYNHSTKNIELLEQGKTFFEQLLVFMQNIGDLRDYDIKVIRTGKDKQTTYTMIPMPKEEIGQDIKDMYEANKVDLQQLLKPYTLEQTIGLMDGKDPKEVFASSKEGDEEVEV